MTDVNDFPSLPMTQCYHWTCGNRISVCNHPPLDGNTPGALVFHCFPVFLGPPRPFGVLLAWGEWKFLVDLLLCSARITVFADAWIADPLGILK